MMLFSVAVFAARAVPFGIGLSMGPTPPSRSRAGPLRTEADMLLAACMEDRRFCPGPTAVALSAGGKGAKGASSEGEKAAAAGMSDVTSESGL